MSLELELDKLRWGAVEIGKVINQPPRRVYYLAEKGLIPVDKVGAILVSTERRLRGHILGGGKPAQASAPAE